MNGINNFFSRIFIHYFRHLKDATILDFWFTNSYGGWFPCFQFLLCGINLLRASLFDWIIVRIWLIDLKDIVKSEFFRDSFLRFKESLKWDRTLRSPSIFLQLSFLSKLHIFENLIPSVLEKLVALVAKLSLVIFRQTISVKYIFTFKTTLEFRIGWCFWFTLLASDLALFCLLWRKLHSFTFGVHLWKRILVVL